MKYSKLTEISASKNITETFKGYNHNLRISDGEFYDMQNITSSHYPVLSPRAKRGQYAYPSSATPVTHYPNGLINKDALCYVDNTQLYINNYAVAGLTLTNTRKQLISMGAYIIIMPDKKYVNTQNLTDYGNIEASYTSSSTVSYELCRVDGTAYSGVTISASEPVSPANMDLWIDTSSTPHTLKQYSATSAMWVQIATTYVKIKAPNIASSFKQYDGVKISGIDATITQLQDLNGQTSILWDVYHDTEGSGADDYIVVVGILDTVCTQTSTLTVARQMPIMDFIIESENRLWGCRYGTDINNNVVNEIYACKLGDFKNWNCFMGLSTDSYTASCGTDGQWTGAITHLGYPLFFKENCLHKVYGNYPSNYQIQTTACRGVMKGAGNSLAIVNEKLFYKSRDGVCCYDGSLPSEVSEAFGDIHYTGVDAQNTDTLRNGAVAGAHHNKYYISMKSEADNQYHLFVYDTSIGMWFKEDNTRADAFCSCNGEMYYIDHTDSKIKTVLGSGTKESGAINWMAETGVIGTATKSGNYTLAMIGKKYVAQLVVRMSLDIGSRVMFYAQYDSCGEWEHLTTLTGTNLRSFAVPIRPKRCDHFRLRIVGIGDAKIFSLAKIIVQGGEI